MSLYLFGLDLKGAKSFSVGSTRNKYLNLLYLSYNNTIRKYVIEILKY